MNRINLYQDIPKYQHLERLGKDEVDGLLDGIVHVQEKLDGANLTVCLDEEGGLFIASRNKPIFLKGEVIDQFRGAVAGVIASDIPVLLKENPDYILRGEWLVKHNTPYSPEYLNKLYVFDIELKSGGYVDFHKVYDIGFKYGIPTAPFIADVRNPDIQYLHKLASEKSRLDSEQDMEGIVIKRKDFTNKYGYTVWGKLVPVRMEGGVLSTKDDLNWSKPEIAFIEVVTPNLVLKNIKKIEQEIGRKTAPSDLPRILGTVFHDLIAEETWGCVKKGGKVDFTRLRKKIYNIIRGYSMKYFNGEIE